MAPLVAELERVGFTDVGTIAQSGNVLVTTDRDARGTARAVEEAVLASSGTVTVAVPIHGEELREVLEVVALPAVLDLSRVLCVVMDREPPAGAGADLDRLDPGRTELIGRIVVQQCPDGVSKAPSVVALVERHWGMKATARNLRMIGRIVAGLG